MRTCHEEEVGKNTSSDVEQLEKEILGLREQLNCATETLVLKDQQLIKLDNDYRAICRSERHVSQVLPLVIVTGRGGAGFALGGPAATQARGAYFVPLPRPTPVRGPAILIPWTGPPFSPPKIYRGLSGAWLGWGLGRGQGGEKGKNTPRPMPVSGPGRGISPGARVLWGPGGPVTNTTHCPPLMWLQH